MSQKQRCHSLRVPNLNFVSFSLLAACGGGGGETDLGVSAPSGGLPSSYVPPVSNYTPPASADIHSFALQSTLDDPYWVAALRSSNFSELYQFVDDFDRVIAYAFPTSVPSYYVGTDFEIDWSPASVAMRIAYEEIFELISDRFDIQFEETAELLEANVLTISQKQAEVGLAGFAYYLHPTDPIGGDIFIDPDYNDAQKSGSTTNFDYELLLHEIGHALGLKHPFETEGSNTVRLSAAEDGSAWTVMTYTHDSSKFDGDFRSFDLMAFAEAYGVRSTYKAGDDTYSFSSISPVFILDGAGVDTVSAAGQSLGVTIDLREGGHSSLGAPSSLVTSSNHIVISSGSEIERAIGGDGADTIIGNDLDNFIDGGAGLDRIFAGEGADVVFGGQGSDIIDLSEIHQSVDTIKFDLREHNQGVDTIYSFAQGSLGDAIELIGVSVGVLQPVVNSNVVPSIDVFDVILRLVGSGISDEQGLLSGLSSGGAFENLQIPIGQDLIVLTAASQATGEDQCLFYVNNTSGFLDIKHLAVLEGNYLDIDSWSSVNIV